MGTEFFEPAVLFAFCCSVLYIVSYSLMAPWWKNPWGRGMVSFSAATALIELPIVLHYAIGWNISQNFFAWYYAASFIVSGLIELYRIRTTYHVQQSDTPHGILDEHEKIKEDHV